MWISKYRKTLKGGYEANYINWVFIVCDVYITDPTTYKDVDIKANKMIGAFYEDKLLLFKLVSIQQIMEVSPLLANIRLSKWYCIKYIFVLSTQQTTP